MRLSLRHTLVATIAGLSLLIAGQPVMATVNSPAAKKSAAIDVASIQRVIQHSVQLHSALLRPTSDKATTARKDAAAANRSGQVPLHLPTGAVTDLSQSHVYRLTTDTTLVSIPIIGLAAGSRISYVFGSDHQLKQALELQLIEHTASTGQVRLWSDGRQVLDREVTEQDTAIAANAMKADPVQPFYHPGQREWWSRLNRCLSGAGISAWTLVALGVVCSAVCAGTAGTGCIPCLLGIDFIAGGTMGYCISYADG